MTLAEQFPQAVAHHEGLKLRHLLGCGLVPGRGVLPRCQLEPVEPVGRQRQQIRQLPDRREGRGTRQFDQHPAGEPGQVQFNGLRGPRQVGDAQDRVARVLAQIGQNAPVARVQEAQRAAAEGLMVAPQQQHAAHPIQQRMGIARLGFDVHRVEPVERVHDRRQHHARGIGAREPAVAVLGPLHRRADAVAVAEMDVVPPCRSRRRNRSPACRASTAAGRSSVRCGAGRAGATGASRRRIPRLMRARRSAA